MNNNLQKVQNLTKPFNTRNIELQMDFEFTTNSRIFFSEKKFQDLYNHTYHFTATLSSKVNDNGIAVDFFLIRKLYEQHLGYRLNADIINEVIPHINPTAENLCLHIYQSFLTFLPDNVTLESISLSETKAHRVIIHKEYFK
ncbi:6-pyruvoyl trahydropterin synthase family protein [Macrococcus armenti]|uniref:6-carboxy-5,6,7,8-tetrahydropterin synthase n=1 Tax=Macrococcus armenti TaxID=2875764 RepID=A0ABY3ZYM9_9STAP|nr:6-carboxytetrahydropterin synthase [Macrococcus armenti]UOB20936.1 6-carboxytetrahydropterin synthase [Macrococcus armenti]